MNWYSEQVEFIKQELKDPNMPSWMRQKYLEYLKWCFEESKKINKII